MKQLLISSLVLILLSLTNCSKINASQINGRIYDGSVAKENQFPFMAHIYTYRDGGTGLEYGICGGFIISEFFILTAGHCVNG